MQTESGPRTSMDIHNVPNPMANRRQQYPKMFYHPDNVHRVVNSVEEADQLKANDAGWREKPYPPPIAAKETAVPMCPPPTLFTLHTRMMEAEKAIRESAQRIAFLEAQLAATEDKSTKRGKRDAAQVA